MNPHHGTPNPVLQEMFDKQAKNDREATFSDGKLNEEDEGDLAYAIAADPKRGKIIIKFPKPVLWLGFDVDSARQLVDALQRKLKELL